MSSAAIPQVGKAAPAFSTTDDADEKVTLSTFKGRYVVLFFYPVEAS